MILLKRYLRIKAGTDPEGCITDSWSWGTQSMLRIHFLADDVSVSEGDTPTYHHI